MRWNPESDQRPQPMTAGAARAIARPEIEKRAAAPYDDGHAEHRLAAAVAAWHWSWRDTRLPSQGAIEEDLLDVLARGRARLGSNRA